MIGSAFSANCSRFGSNISSLLQDDYMPHNTTSNCEPWMQTASRQKVGKSKTFPILLLSKSYIASTSELLGRTRNSKT